LEKKEVRLTSEEKKLTKFQKAYTRFTGKKSVIWHRGGETRKHVFTPREKPKGKACWTAAFIETK